MIRKSRQLLQSMRNVEKQLERLDVAIITRYPDSARAADEYGALRKALNATASASMLHRQNLISLINAIDEGADVQTIRGRMSDLLSTLSMKELRPDDPSLLNALDREIFFEVVGDKAIPRSAWVMATDEGSRVIQRGYVAKFPAIPDGSEVSSPLVAINDQGAIRQTSESLQTSASGESEPTNPEGDNGGKE